MSGLFHAAIPRRPGRAGSETPAPPIARPTRDSRMVPLWDPDEPSGQAIRHGRYPARPAPPACLLLDLPGDPWRVPTGSATTAEAARRRCRDRVSVSKTDTQTGQTPVSTGIRRCPEATGQGRNLRSRGPGQGRASAQRRHPLSADPQARGSEKHAACRQNHRKISLSIVSLWTPGKTRIDAHARWMRSVHPMVSGGARAAAQLIPADSSFSY
jgi:hypothetical protein